MPNLTGVSARPRWITELAAFHAATCARRSLVAAGLLQPIDDRRQHVVLDRLAVVRHVAARRCRRSSRAARRADRAAVCARSRSMHLLDHHHALRAAEAAKRRVRDRVGLAAMRDDLDVLEEIGIVEVHERAVIDRARTGPPNSRSATPASRVSADMRPARVEAHRRSRRGNRAACRSSACRLSRSRRSLTGRARLRASTAAAAAISAGCVSLPPKPPPMRRHCTVTACARTAQRMRDDLLHLGRMLGRAVDQHARRLPAAWRSRSGLRDRNGPGRRWSASPASMRRLREHLLRRPRAHDAPDGST